MKFPQKKDRQLAAMIGVSPQTFANWRSDTVLVRMPNAETLYLGYKALGLIRGEEAADGRAYPGEWPVRGLAAADDSQGSRVPDTDDLGEPITYPPGLTLVPVRGDSMSPVVLPGQYVMIDREREGFETDGGLAVVAISDAGADDDRERRESLPGTYVKRCFWRGDFYLFTSVNSAYSPFSAWRDHCRLWPVLGVWFAGQGKPPELWRALPEDSADV